jgi:hypothetical protein
VSYRSICPECGTEDVYHGFFSIECWNIKCSKWTEKAAKERKEYERFSQSNGQEKPRSKTREEDDTLKLYPHTPIDPNKFSSNPNKTPTYPWGRGTGVPQSGPHASTASVASKNNDDYGDICDMITDEEIDELFNHVN